MGTNMKFMALLASAAAASAQLVSYPNGAVAPAKTPEVVAAEAAHFAAKGLPAWGAYPYGTYGWNGYAGAYAGAYGWAGYNNYGYAGYPYAAYGGYPYAPALVAHPNGAVVPAEPADVVAARAEHLAAKGAPLVAPVAPAATVAPYYAPGFAGLVAHPNGALVPAEPADVVEARAEHLAAHA